jgi:hypothetical protein
LISSAVIILFSSLFEDSFIFILWLFLPSNICFFLSLRFSFCFSTLHYFFPWLCVPSFLTYSTTIFSKQRGLYFMGLSDVIGEESLSPARIRWRTNVHTVQATCTINPYTGIQMLYWPGSGFLLFNLGKFPLNVGVNITQQWYVRRVNVV